jgi:hypothetical protein
MARFAAQDVIAPLGPVSDGEVITSTLEGHLRNGTLFAGFGPVVIAKRGR